MSQKRKDNKGRILRNGESQRKDGRYAYKYIGLDGKSKFVYSWKLEKTDRLPQGKRDGLSLREKERQIQRDLDDGIYHDLGNTTIIELVQEYVNKKTNIKDTTREKYLAFVSVLKKEEFSYKKINDVSKIEAKNFFTDLKLRGMKYGTISNIRGLLRPSFEMAIENGMIRENPFNFRMNSIIENDSNKKIPLTKDQELKLMDILGNEPTLQEYRDSVYMLLHTGLRISEFSGLTFDNINLEDRTITVDHQLIKMDNAKLIIQEPKSKAGFRKIPISRKTCQCLERIIANRKTPSTEPMVDNLTGFIFLNTRGEPTHRQQWDYVFDKIQNRYDALYPEDSLKITAHICRHTFCSNMAMSGMSPKALQYIMGHSSISVTLDVYTHLQYENVEAEFERVTKRMEC